MSPRSRFLLRRLRAIFSNFSKDGGLYLSAAVSFYAMLSIFPLLFLLIHYFASLLMKSRNLQTEVFWYVKALFPLAGELLRNQISDITQQNGGSYISLALFLWVGSSVFNSLDYSLNIIFKTKKKRRFLFSMLISFGLVLVSGFLFVISFWVGYAPTLLRKVPNEFVSSKAVVFFTRSVVLQFMPLVLTFIAFTIVYKILPKVKVPWRLAAAAGAIAGILWEAAKYAFTWYVGEVVNLTIYGSLSAMIVFMLWIYYSSAILLLVAEGLHLAVEEIQLEK